MKKKWILAGAGVFLAAALAVVGLVVHSFVRKQIPESPVVQAEDQTASPQGTLTATVVPTVAPSASSDRVIASFSYPGFSLERLMELSPIIVRGKIVEKSDPFKVVPVGGTGYMPYTNYYLEAFEFIWGKEYITDPQRIPIRLEGGTLEESNIIVENETKLAIGGEYILFLYPYLFGGGYNIDSKDMHYGVTGPQGVFPKAGEEGYIAGTGGKDIKQGEVIDSAKLKAIASDQTQPPLDVRWIEANENMGMYLENGMITQEYYEQIKEEWTQFAKVVE